MTYLCREDVYLIATGGHVTSLFCMARNDETTNVIHACRDKSKQEKIKILNEARETRLKYESDFVQLENDRIIYHAAHQLWLWAGPRWVQVQALFSPDPTHALKGPSRIDRIIGPDGNIHETKLSYHDCQEYGGEKIKNMCVVSRADSNTQALALSNNSTLFGFDGVAFEKNTMTPVAATRKTKSFWSNKVGTKSYSARKIKSLDKMLRDLKINSFEMLTSFFGAAPSSFETPECGNLNTLFTFDCDLR